MIAAARIVRRESAAIGEWPAQTLPLLRRIYAARGMASLEQAQPKLSALLPPEALGGLDAATSLLMRAIDDDAHVVIVGDFDCDGATAAALAVRGLKMLGAKHVTPTVPNRMIHGYGLSPLLVEHLEALQPDLLVTVDTGIACHAGVAAAKARGWQVLVTDHHLPGDALPGADVIVNPNLRGDAFPSKALAGVGVMFYVLLALRRTLREAGKFAGTEPDLPSLLDLVAVGTVADLVPLDANNRALVAAGLRRIRAGRANAGLRALIEVSARNAQTLSASDIGFAIGPRLNAAGRLEDMALGIECLLCDDIVRARELAQTLHEINAERKGVQQQMLDEAESALAHAKIGDEVQLAAILFDEQWHPGVVGLVASKLKDRLHRPALAFAPSEPGSTSLRGSARSIPGLHIRDALAAVDAMHPGLIERFGGHAMAAGLTMDAAKLDAFRDAFVAQVGTMLSPQLLHAEILSDGELLPHEFDRAHAEALRDGGPWGQGFAEPLFDGEFEVVDFRVLKDAHLKLTLRHPQRREPLNAIHFFGWDGAKPGRRLRVAYRLVADDYRGGDAIQLLVEHREAV